MTAKINFAEIAGFITLQLAGGTRPPASALFHVEFFYFFIRDFDSGFSGKGVLLSAANFNADQAGDVVATQLAQGETLRVFDALGDSAVDTLLSSLFPIKKYI